MAKIQNKKVVLSVKPKEYLKQGMRYCGGYTIKAVLSAYNLDDGRHPKDYLPLFIRNGYSPTGKYSAIRRQLISHWITIWGYDDKERIFFVYDSCVEPKCYDKIPVGNVKRTYKQILRDWKGAFYFRFKNFLYIPVIKI